MTKSPFFSRESSRSPPAAAWTRLRGGDESLHDRVESENGAASSGQTLFQVVVVLPLLLVFLAVAIDLGRSVHTTWTLARLTHEAASLIANGVDPGRALDAAVDAACPLLGDGGSCPVANAADWRVIHSRFVANGPEPTAYVLAARVARGDLEAAGRVNAWDLAPSSIRDASWPERHVIEVFHRLDPISPAAAFLPSFESGAPLYERAIF